MFDIGWGELVVIGVVALIVIGPKELPTVLRTLGQTMGKIRRMASEFQGQFQDALREAELHDLKKQADDLKSAVGDFSDLNPLADTQKEIESAFEAEPKSEPAAAEPAQGEAAPSPAIAAPVAVIEAPAPQSAFDLPQAPAASQGGDGAAAEPPARTAGGAA